MYRIWIVEDDEVIAAMLEKGLRAWGYEARTAKSFENLLPEFSGFEPHLVLLDISLPYYNGFYWCAQLRRISTAPIVFLSSRAENMDIVMAMNMGGDDYISKPVSMDVLAAKVQAMLRRCYDYESACAGSDGFGGAILDAGAACLHLGDQKMELTKNELRILQTLLHKKGQVVGREEIMLALWDNDSFIDDNTLSVNVNRLRKKLDAWGLARCITTHKGQGYRIDD